MLLLSLGIVVPPPARGFQLHHSPRPPLAPPPPPLLLRSRGRRRPRSLAPRFAAPSEGGLNLEQMEELWQYREGFAQGSFEALLTCKDLLREAGEVDDDEEGGEGGDSSLKSAFVTSAVAVVFGAFVLRLGGRAALVSLLGLDFVAELDIGSQIDQVVAFADALGPLSVLAFVLAWVVAKTFLLDFLSVALAFASGIIFGGVLQGALLSAT